MDSPLLYGRTVQKPDNKGKKLFLTLVVRALRFLYLLPNGSGVKKEWPGWDKSLIMLAAFPRQNEGKMESMVVSLIWVTDWATSTTFCNSLRSWAELFPKQAVMQPHCLLSMVHV